MRLVRTAIAGAALLVLGLAVAAEAATLGLAADQSTYALGETITLSLLGDGEGEAVSELFVQTSYDETLVAPTGVQSQDLVLDVAGSLDLADSPGWETMLSQLNLFGATEVFTVTATAQFSADAPGVATFELGSDPFAGCDPDEVCTFTFGSVLPEDLPSVSVTIVPEPATGVLLALGPLGLGLAARRR